jgi:hypothetical protein
MPGENCGSKRKRNRDIYNFRVFVAVTGNRRFGQIQNSRFKRMAAIVWTGGL